MKASRYVYKSNPVVELILAVVIVHSAWQGYQPSLAWVISRTTWHERCGLLAYTKACRQLCFIALQRVLYVLYNYVKA